MLQVFANMLLGYSLSLYIELEFKKELPWTNALIVF